MTKKIYPDVPRVAVGAVIIHQNKVLLVRRGHPPAQNMWAIPGGGVHLGETLQEAAEREILEETGLKVKAGQVIYTFDTIVRDAEGRVQYHYVILDLQAEVLDSTQSLIPGDDASDAAWFSRADLDRPDLPIVEVTRTLVRNLMNGSL